MYSILIYVLFSLSELKVNDDGTFEKTEDALFFVFSRNHLRTQKNQTVKNGMIFHDSN